MLFVDDEVLILRALSRMAAARKIAAVCVSDLDGVRRALTSHHDITCVVSDFQMPKDNGVAILELVRATRPHVRRMIMTGHADVEVLTQALNVGLVEALVQKPFTTERMFAAIEGLVRRG